MSAALGAPSTTTDCVTPPTLNIKCRTGFVPDARLMVCVSVSKPAASTVNRYTPIGAAGSSNSPSPFVVACKTKSESAACNAILAPAMGRCSGSCTTPCTVANTVANAGREAASNAAATREE